MPAVPRAPAHAPYFVKRLWAHFVAGRPRRRHQWTPSIELYVDGGYEIRPVVEAILMHPQLYTGPSLVKPPMVLIAGMLRARDRGIDSDSWTWISDMAGQRLFRPPNVSGWDERRWLDTSRFRGRWYATAEVIDPDQPDEDTYDRDETPPRRWTRRWPTGATRRSRTRPATRCWTSASCRRGPDRGRLAGARVPRRCARTRCGC